MTTITKLSHDFTQFIRALCLGLLLASVAYAGLALVALTVHSFGGIQVLAAVGASVFGAAVCAAGMGWAQWLVQHTDARAPRSPSYTSIGDEEATIVVAATSR